MLMLWLGHRAGRHWTMTTRLMQWTRAQFGGETLSLDPPRFMQNLMFGRKFGTEQRRCIRPIPGTARRCIAMIALITGITGITG